MLGRRDPAIDHKIEICMGENGWASLKKDG